jgi:hypothetical protein
VTRFAALLVLTLAASTQSAPAPGVNQENCPATGTLTVSTQPLSPEQMTRELALVPGTVARPGLASPTRAPWINTNGSRFVRKPTAKYRYELPEGKGALGAAEALVYSADAVLQIAPADLPAVCRLLSFVKNTPSARLPDLADIGIVDDDSAIVGEVMNLFVRRNLLFQIVPAPQPNLAVNVKLGTPEYPVADAADPSAFALKIRRQLTDERRRMRIFGSEVVVGRLTGDDERIRLHLLNYGGREIAGLRVRLRGTYRGGDAYLPGQGRIDLADFSAADGATEFSVPVLTTYAIVDVK